MSSQHCHGVSKNCRKRVTCEQHPQEHFPVQKLSKEHDKNLSLDAEEDFRLIHANHTREPPADILSSKLTPQQAMELIGSTWASLFFVDRTPPNVPACSTPVMVFVSLLSMTSMVYKHWVSICKGLTCQPPKGFCTLSGVLLQYRLLMIHYQLALTLYGSEADTAVLLALKHAEYAYLVWQAELRAKFLRKARTLKHPVSRGIADEALNVHDKVFKSVDMLLRSYQTELEEACVFAYTSNSNYEENSAKAAFVFMSPEAFQSIADMFSRNPPVRYGDIGLKRPVGDVVTRTLQDQKEERLTQNWELSFEVIKQKVSNVFFLDSYLDVGLVFDEDIYIFTMDGIQHVADVFRDQAYQEHVRVHADTQKILVDTLGCQIENLMMTTMLLLLGMFARVKRRRHKFT